MLITKTESRQHNRTSFRVPKIQSMESVQCFFDFDSAIALFRGQSHCRDSAGGWWRICNSSQCENTVNYVNQLLIPRMCWTFQNLCARMTEREPFTNALKKLKNYQLVISRTSVKYECPLNWYGSQNKPVVVVLFLLRHSVDITWCMVLPSYRCIILYW